MWSIETFIRNVWLRESLHWQPTPPCPALIMYIYTDKYETLTTICFAIHIQIFEWRTLSALGQSESSVSSCSVKLREISHLTHGLSGRTIRKLPFLAHALYIRDSSTNLPTFLTGLEATVRKQIQERADLQHQTDSGVSTWHLHTRNARVSTSILPDDIKTTFMGVLCTVIHTHLIVWCSRVYFS